MMKLFKLLLALSVIAFISSCSQNYTELEYPTTFPLCGEHPDNIESRQERITTIPLYIPCDAQNLFIHVDLSECFPDDMDLYECAVDGAIAAYNALPENIGIGMTIITDLSELPVGESVNATIVCSYFPAIAAASRRGSPFSVSNIIINRNVSSIYPCQPGPDCCQLQKTVMHELGHALGLGHTEGGSDDAEWIPGTPQGEPKSIFNSTVVDTCNGGCEFTPGDLAALEILYPAPYIDGPEIICVGLSATYCLKGQGFKDPNTTAYWSTQNTIPAPGTQQFRPGCTTFSSSTLGYHTITVWVTDHGCTYSVTKTILVVDNPDCPKKF
ncbi:zinc-dependent metalloprotease [Saprospiraceae bacterium]|nr:zinc-dependent metalloprotease [Saprospiraceae bacterium]